MIFISYAQLIKDVIAWSQELPRDLDLIVGLPRSGMLPATILALHRNIALADLDTFVSGAVFEGGFRDQQRKIKKVLIVDDSILSGKSFIKASNKLNDLSSKYEILYGAVYFKPNNLGDWFYYHRKLELPRIFEWNMFHSYWTQRSCMDIDGVLCRDPTREENDDGLRYHNFLCTADPRHIPTVQVHTLCTSRLEKYRVDTVKWLHHHGVLYKNLIMHPASSKQERMKMGDHAKRKARAYQESGQYVFFESSQGQSQEIHRLTNKPVICTDTMVLYA